MTILHVTLKCWSGVDCANATFSSLHSVISKTLHTMLRFVIYRTFWFLKASGNSYFAYDFMENRTLNRMKTLDETQTLTLTRGRFCLRSNCWRCDRIRRWARTRRHTRTCNCCNLDYTSCDVNNVSVDPANDTFSSLHLFISKALHARLFFCNIWPVLILQSILATVSLHQIWWKTEH